MAENKERVAQLRENYEKACSDYVAALNEAWGISEGWWIGGDIGGIYCFLDAECLTMEDVVLAVDNNICIDAYFEWSEYNQFACEFGQNRINLKSWIMGMRGLPKQEQESLRKLKKDFEEAMRTCKEKY